MPLYRRGRGEMEIENFLDATRTVLAQIGGFCQDPDRQNNVKLDDLENAVERMADICNTVAVIVDSLVIDSTVYCEMTDLQKFLEDIREELTKEIEEMSSCEGSGKYQCPVSYSGERGRPRFEIDKSQLDFLRRKHFRWASIARLLGVSERTQTKQDTSDWLGVLFEIHPRRSEVELKQ